MSEMDVCVFCKKRQLPEEIAIQFMIECICDKCLEDHE